VVVCGVHYVRCPVVCHGVISAAGQFILVGFRSAQAST